MDTDDTVVLCERTSVSSCRQFDTRGRVRPEDRQADVEVRLPDELRPESCQRLPNGNTLICLLNQNQVIEVDPSGEIVWDYQAKDGLQVGRGVPPLSSQWTVAVETNNPSSGDLGVCSTVHCPLATDHSDRMRYTTTRSRGWSRPTIGSTPP